MCFRRKADNDLFFFFFFFLVRGAESEKDRRKRERRMCSPKYAGLPYILHLALGQGGPGGEDWVKAVLLVAVGLDKHNMSAAEKSSLASTCCLFFMTRSVC